MIVFDLQALQSELFGPRGVGRYTAELARALALEHPAAVEAFAWNDARPWSPLLDELDQAASLGERLVPFSSLDGRDIDLLHVNAPFDLIDFDRLVSPMGAAPVMLTCHDLIPYRFPEVFLREPAERAKYVTRLGWLVAADAIVTNSQATADDVIELLGVSPARVTVIGAGTAPAFRPPDTSATERLALLQRSFPDLSPGYVLVPTGMHWHKNVAGAVEAYGRLPEELRNAHQLVIACDVEDVHREAIARAAGDAGVAAQVLVTGFVPEPELVLLYQSAELVVFPSYYEGFGFPVLEARRCGARVICSDGSSLAEVMPAEVARFDPWDVDDIASHLRRALTDADVRRQLDVVEDPGFTWSAAADRLVQVYERLRRS